MVHFITSFWEQPGFPVTIVTGGGTVGRIQWDPARCLDWGKSGQPEKHTET